MKSNIFLVAIFLLIAGGIYMFTYGDGLGGKTVSVNGENKSIFNTLTTKTEWNYIFSYKESNEIIFASGKAEYKKDGTFIKFLTINFFKDENGEVSTSDKFLVIEGGLRIEGKWSISENGEYWIEEVNTDDCLGSIETDKTGKEIDLCNEYIENPILLKKFGKVSNDLRAFSFEYLSGVQMKIVGKQYDIDSHYNIQLN